MAQHDIMMFLHKHRGKKFNTQQVAEALGLKFNTVCSSLCKLRKHNMINWETNYDDIHPKAVVWVGGRKRKKK